MTSAIKAEELSKTFPRSAGYLSILQAVAKRRQWVTALDRVSLDVEAGELFGLIGPNGAGKTTLIKVLCTLILPTSGTARLFGCEVVREAAKVREMVNIITADERSFYWRLSGRDNLAFHASLWGLTGRKKRQKVDELLCAVGLDDKADMRFQNYSTGMRQRLAIARGLLGNPRVLFIDEPTRSLDPVNARAVRRLVKEKVMGEGTTVVLATHHLGEAEELCHRLAIMDKGRVLACGSAAELREGTKHGNAFYVEVRNLSQVTLDKLRHVSGVTGCLVVGRRDGLCTLELILKQQDALPQAIRVLAEAGADIYSCNARGKSLEEVLLTTLKEEVSSPCP